MRLYQVLVLIAASFLVASDALSTTTASDEVDGPNQRVLRTHTQFKVTEDESNTEERGPLSRSQVKELVKEVGIDWKLVKANPMYLQRHEKYAEYLEKMNEILVKQKSKGSPRIKSS
ncbi:putative secreted RxLR effector protein [Phytophthora cinnamomi]|uniref:putative secreted RxLR effector protein n=1 Tax=Phytophthora cinnamomi TaxID=4785 RepID=UPI003559AAB4|nr:putative secreted RxLR effector protein [Phytophthora cinnamomi]